jgi:3-deoxy-D-manno-octulosonic acid kinase
MERLKSLGYEIHQEHSTTLIFKPGHKLENLPLQGTIGRPTTLKGRRQLRFLEPDMIVRELAHGGILADLSADRFLTPARSVREVMISAYLIAHGIPTPEIMGLRLIQNGWFKNIAVITRLVPKATDLIAYLATAHDNAAQVFEEAGRLMRRVHDLKVYHADLHLKNFLLDQEQHLWLLDLDKAWLLPILPGLLKTINIRRFFRSGRKWARQGRIILPPDYAIRFRKGYRQESVAPGDQGSS